MPTIQVPLILTIQAPDRVQAVYYASSVRHTLQTQILNQSTYRGPNACWVDHTDIPLCTLGHKPPTLRTVA